MEVALVAGRASRRRRTGARVGETEVGAESTALLQRLREHLVLADVVVRDGAAGETHRLLEVGLGYLWDWIFFIQLEFKLSFRSRFTFNMDELIELFR